jgi:ferredoxin-NADP reductase
VSSICLAAPDDSPLPAAMPGQYLTLRVPGAGSPAPVRSYSLSSAPGASSYRITVKHEPHGTVSGYMTSRLSAGDLLDVAAPRGDFVLRDGTGPVLLISAGVGVTPVLAMLYALAAAGSGREIWWIHAARSPREHALAGEAETLLASLPRAREQIFYSHATAAECRPVHAAPGHVTQEALAALAIPPDASAYICGPATFMTGVRDALAATGVDPGAIRTELFGALPPVNPGVTAQQARPPHPPAGPAGTGPQVTFARSGITAAFGSRWRSVLELADACDVPARWSCRTGVCHTCVTPVLSGQVGYRPDPLEPPADGQLLICCARPGTDLVVDM